MFLWNADLLALNVALYVSAQWILYKIASHFIAIHANYQNSIDLIPFLFANEDSYILSAICSLSLA